MNSLKHWQYTILCIFAVVFGSIFAAILERYNALPLVAPEQWDLIATIFWSMLPFLLCILLAVVIKAVVRLVPIVALVLESKAALNDALMWQARHAAKAQRKAL